MLTIFIFGSMLSKWSLKLWNWIVSSRKEREKGKKVLTWRTQWSGTSASGLWRWRRTARGNCGWSFHSRASRTPPSDTDTWSHQRAGWHIRRHFCTRPVHSGLMMHLARSARLWETNQRQGLGAVLHRYAMLVIISQNCSLQSCTALAVPCNVDEELPVITTSHQFIILILSSVEHVVHPWLKFRLIMCITHLESSCFNKKPLILSQADLQRCNSLVVKAANKTRVLE